MALSYKARRRLALFLLLVWLPLYIVLASLVLSALPRLPIVLEVLIYILAAFLWIVPFRFAFLGVGKADPEKEAPRYLDDEWIARDKAKLREMPEKRK